MQNSLKYEESWCVPTNTQIHPAGVAFSILPQEVQRKRYHYQHSTSPNRQTKELLTSVWSQILETRVTLGEHASPAANTQLSSKHNWPKQNHSAGEGAEQRVTSSRYYSCFLVCYWRTCWCYAWQQVKIRVQSGWKLYPFRVAHVLWPLPYIQQH